MIDKCIDVYKNLNILIRDDDISLSPCCVYPPDSAGPTIDFQNNSSLVAVRQQWDNNIIPVNCQGCLRHEGSNRWYKDNGYNDTNVELIRLDYWTGDTCNLRCAICGPKNSSAWKEELKIPIIERKHTVNHTWKTLDLSILKYVHFNGGEPLLSKEHVKFLEAIPIKSQVSINYNTNGTIRPSVQLLALWNEFKLVTLDFSIDDIEERFEYQRYPAKWSDVADNLQWYIDYSPVNCMFAVNTTVSILNQHNLKNLNAWLSANFAFNRVTDPIEHRQQAVKGILSEFTTKAVKYLDACDLRRGTNWRTIFPELV